MTLLIAGLALALHAAVMLAGAALLPGGAASLAALCRREAPPSPWASLREWRALLRKRVLLPEAAGAVFRLAPCLAAAAALAAALLVPSFSPALPTARLADLLLILALLGLSELATLAGALDPGTWPAAEAASAALARIGLAVPVLTLLGLDLALMTGGTSLPAAMRWLGEASVLPLPAMTLAYAAFLLLLPQRVLLADEFGAATGLELESGGAALALVRHTAQLRRLTALSILAGLLPPWFAMPPGGWLGGLLLWGGKILVLETALRLASHIALPPFALRAALALALAATAGMLLALGQSAA